MSKPLKVHESSSSRSDTSAGVRFSAIILVLLACALGICGLFCLIAVVMLLVNHGRSLTGFALGIGSFIVLAASFVCLRAASALRNGRLWGANVATVCGGLAIALGGVIAFDFFYARGQVADDYFLYPVAPILLLLGAWLCIYLNTPHVRSSFAEHSG